MPDLPAPLEALRAALEASRAGLLAAITGLTERDFMAIVPRGLDDLDSDDGEGGGEDESVTSVLVALGRRERVDAARVRAGLGIEARAQPVSGGAAPARVLPPQAIHALAGARHDTLQLLATIVASGLAADALDSTLTGADDPPEASVRSLLEAIVRRETRAAERIRSPRGEA